MTAPLVVDLDSLSGEPFPIPGGSDPVESAQVWRDPDTRYFASLIRFPSGWSRPETGFYVSGEEFVVLEGAIELSGVRVEAGQYAQADPGFVRSGTRADRCVTFAWFNGPARWVTDAPSSSPAAGMLIADISDAGETESPFGSRGRRLFGDDHVSTWLLGDAVDLRAGDGFVQALSVPDRRFVHLAAGQSLDSALAPPVILRVGRTSPEAPS